MLFYGSFSMWLQYFRLVFRSHVFHLNYYISIYQFIFLYCLKNLHAAIWRNVILTEYTQLTLLQTRHLFCFNTCNFFISSPELWASSELFWSPVVRRLSVRPSVRPSVCKLSVSHFHLLLQNHLAISTKLGTKRPWVKGILVWSNEGPRPSQRGDYWEIIKINWQL